MSQPPPASTAGKLRNIAEEGAVGFRVVTIEEEMGAGDSREHGMSLSKGHRLVELRSAGQPGRLSPRGLWRFKIL